jgi:hypothetical protein
MRFYYARTTVQLGMPVVRLQDTPIVEKKLGVPLSEAYLFDG